MTKLLDALKDCQHGSAERAKVAAKIVAYLRKHPMSACMLTSGEVGILRAEGLAV